MPIDAAEASFGVSGHRIRLVWGRFWLWKLLGSFFLIFPCKNAFKSVKLDPLKLLQPKNVLKSPEFSFLKAFRVKNDLKWAAQIKFEKFLKISRRLKGILSDFLVENWIFTWI